MKLKFFLRLILPRPIRVIYRWWQYYCVRFLSRKAGFHDFQRKSSPGVGRKRILFYHVNGLSVGGTEKFLQIIAKHLNKKFFDVFFMFSSQKSQERKTYLEKEAVKLIDFSFRDFEQKSPYLITEMAPSVFDVIRSNQIDLLVTAGPGTPEFPVVNLNGDFPVVQINIFAGINIQRNIKKHLCISNELAGVLKKELPENKVETVYIQSEGTDSRVIERGKSLRRKLGIPEDSVVFGRIGRSDANIFDPIGILAFEKAVKSWPKIFYLIVSPAEEMRKIVSEKNIPNVIFIDKITEEEDIWEFHAAIDVLAHFRKDGETMGLNIAETMLSGRPVITHRSEYWNAHLEYLEPGFSFVAEPDNIEQYSGFIADFAKNGRGLAKEMGEKARGKAVKLFLIQNNIKRIENILTAALTERR